MNNWISSRTTLGLTNPAHLHCPCWGTQTLGPHPGAGCAWVPPPAGLTGHPGSDQLHTMRSQSKSPSGTKSSHRAMGQITGTSDAQTVPALKSWNYIYGIFKQLIWEHDCISYLPGLGLRKARSCSHTNTNPLWTVRFWQQYRQQEATTVHDSCSRQKYVCMVTEDTLTCILTLKQSS